VETLGRPATSVTGPARVALDLGGRVADEPGAGDVLVTPDAFLASTVVDIRLARPGALPERPVLHVGATLRGVHARPLADDLVRLTFDPPLPLRTGDRLALRDPGSRDLWGATVVDPSAPPLGRRGAAGRRARLLDGLDGALRTELAARGLARRSLLRRAGVRDEPTAPGTLEVGDWLVDPVRATELRGRLAEAVHDAAAGLTLQAAQHLLGLPDARLVPALVSAPLRVDRGRVVKDRDEGLPDPLRRAVDRLRADLTARPFAAPDAARLRELGLTPRDIPVLHRSGHLLHLGEGVVLLPDAADAAVQVLGALPQPFGVSEARQALGTSRRVALPLLAHLDRSGRTLRLPDDRRRLRGP
jgi:selenocysteine-specific elongation factor